MSTTLAPEDVAPEEKRRELDRVLKSQTFLRCDQLKRFLQYICEKDIAGKMDEVNEYSIGVEALRRPPDYSPTDDSSVRTRAHALRQKLQEYYRTEDPGSVLRIEVPKGAYSPHFHRHAPVRIPSPEPAVAVVAPATPTFQFVAKPKKIGSRWMIAMAFVCGVICTSFFARAIGRERSPDFDPVLRNAWGSMLSPGAPVEILIATPPAMLLHSYKEGQEPAGPMTLFPTPKEVAGWYQGLQMMDGGGKLYMHTTQDIFLFGDSLAAASAVQLITASGALAEVFPESNLRAFTLRDRNVVLIGSPNYSPLAARFLMNMPFSVHYDAVHREEVVSEGEPGVPGHRVFRPAHDAYGMLTKAYGLITVLPSGPRSDSATQTLIFSGITSAGPQAALEFFRSPEALRTLRDKLQAQGISKLPAAYQVVVRCGLDHNLALSWQYETHQVLKGLPLVN